MKTFNLYYYNKFNILMIYIIYLLFGFFKLISVVNKRRFINI